MSVAMIVPLAVQLLTLSLRIADIIDKSGDVDAQDKAALKALIKEAKDGVTYINEEAKENS